MGEPENHTLQLLKKLRHDIATVRRDLVGAIESLEAKVGERSRAVDKRLDTVAHMAYAESILSRYAVTDIEGRVMRIEDYLQLRKDAGAPV